jgi:hypothetical protein
VVSAAGSFTPREFEPTECYLEELITRGAIFPEVPRVLFLKNETVGTGRMVATDSLFRKTCTLSRNMAKKDSAETHDKFFYNFLKSDFSKSSK